MTQQRYDWKTEALQELYSLRAWIAGQQDITHLGWIDRAIHLVRNGEEWISVEERLPETLQPVSAVIRGRVFPGHYRGDCSHPYWWEYGKQCSWSPQDVTHWMPSPEPPKEDANG